MSNLAPTPVIEPPYCADCGGPITISLNGLEGPVTAKCNCAAFVEGQMIPDWWCLDSFDRAVLGFA